MRHSAVLILIGCATLAMFVETSMAETLCPYCVCLPSYSPVCGKAKETGKLRGFSSRCVLECTNKCRKNKYEYFYNGRCGKAPTTAPIVPSSDSSTSEPLLQSSDASKSETTPPTSTSESTPVESTPMESITMDSTPPAPPVVGDLHRQETTVQSDSDQNITMVASTN